MMEKIKNIFGEEYMNGLKNLSNNFDFDGKATNGPIYSGQGIVFDEKDLNKIKGIIIGEAPGADEVIKNTPFIGKAGQNLKGNIKNQDIFYITNSIKFRPIEKTERGYKNRTPKPKETEFSSEFLKKELFYLEKIGVNKILLVGNKALETMIFICKNNKAKITLNDEEINIKEIKKIKTSDLINNWITFEIEGKIFNTYLIFHTSPLNYNKVEKRKLIIEGIKVFEKYLTD